MEGELRTEDALVIASIYNRLVIIERALQTAGWKTKSFQKPDEALTHLRTHTYQAVFCDEHLRGASAKGFLVWTRRLHPRAGFYLFSDEETPAGFGSTSAPNAILPFPPLKETLPQPPEHSRNLYVTPPTHENDYIPLKGDTSTIALAELLEMVGTAKQSATIILDRGRITLKDGLITHAVSRNEQLSKSGMEALVELLMLEKSQFRVLPYEPVKRHTINQPAAAAILDATRLADEERHNRQLLSMVRRDCPSVTAAAIGYPLADHPRLMLGEGEALYARAKKLLEGNRKILDATPTIVVVATEQWSYGLAMLPSGNLLTASAPAKDSRQLHVALHGLLRGT
ncbi:MAG: DUF4388 domain-containing protein [Trueperaceae bacterium]|nr:MAG: DUF4388 domain-containing protein [Trueperaceae bacterium]